jgi:hypothetical protein
MVDLKSRGIVVLRHLAVFATMSCPFPDDPAYRNRDAHEAADLNATRARDCKMPSRLLTRSKLADCSRSSSIWIMWPDGRKKKPV